VDVAADERSVVVHWLGASPAFERYDGVSAGLDENHRVGCGLPVDDVGVQHPDRSQEW
jgi:hypothetical protein